ncbi:hypothetical protein DN730_08000 [Marinomonas piezotolerans]|uniref:Uncharacterized protein n=1 Tax=Marinomonas piezotolerans TaxID=2213058 RepID=A0A370U9B5_9GAMM|nr:hypothetical protein [Marinomonas piezotolerans]RDL44338.1 hypothetical protein DN730_08000 [Marinomonas piezotolerans]
MKDDWRVVPLPLSEHHSLSLEAFAGSTRLKPSEALDILVGDALEEGVQDANFLSDIFARCKELMEERPSVVH